MVFFVFPDNTTPLLIVNESNFDVAVVPVFDKMIIFKMYPLDFVRLTCAVVNEFYSDADIELSHLDSQKNIDKAIQN